MVRFYGRRRYPKRRRVVHRRGRRITRRVKRVERRTKKLSNLIETKYRDYQTVGGGLAITAAGGAITPFGAGCWNEITISPGQAERIGWQVYCSKLMMRFYLYGQSDYFDAVRLLVVKWKRLPPGIPTGTVPGIGRVIDTGGINSLIAPYSWVTKDYFRVLHDKVYLVGNNGNSVKPYACPPARYVTKRFKIKCKTTYDATSSGILTNGIAIYAVSNSGASPHPTIEVWCRLTYQDA